LKRRGLISDPNQVAARRNELSLRRRGLSGDHIQVAPRRNFLGKKGTKE
jgi:hypothetical protein